MKRKLAVAGALVVGAFLLLVLVVALSSPSGSISTSEDGTFTVELAMLTVPIAEDEPLVDAPTQYLGVLHPRPEFDTSSLGADMTFEQDTSRLPDLDPDDVIRAVYLGNDIHGEPYYIWQSGSPDLRRLVGQIVADFGAVGRLESSYGGQIVGDPLWQNGLAERIAEIGLQDAALRSSSGEPTTLTMEWHGLPSEVAAVVVYDNGEPIGWQRPVSGSVGFHFETDSQAPGSVSRSAELVALTNAGEEWNRYTPFG